MLLLLECRYTSPAALEKIWHISRGREHENIRHYERQKLIKRFTLPASRRTIIMLTRVGGAEAKTLVDSARQVRTSPTKIGETAVRHNLIVQIVAANTAARLGHKSLAEFGTVLFEPKLDFGFRPRKPIADLLIAPTRKFPSKWVADESRDAVVFEIELSLKTRRRLHDKIEGLAAALLDDKFLGGTIVWLVPNAKIENALNSAIDRFCQSQSEYRAGGNFMTVRKMRAVPKL